MKHFFLLGFVVGLTLVSLRNFTAPAYVLCASLHKCDHRERQVFKGNQGRFVSKIGRAVLPEEAKQTQLLSRRNPSGHARLAPTCQEPKQACSSTRSLRHRDGHGSGTNTEKKANLKTIVENLQPQGRRGAEATTEKKSNLKSAVGLMVGLSILGAVPANAQAAQTRNSLPPAVSKLFGTFGNPPPAPSTKPTVQPPILNKLFGNIGSKAALATPVLKAKPDPNPAAPFQDRNPNAFLDSDRNVVDKDDIRERLRKQQKPGKNNPYTDGDQRSIYASFWVDSNV